METLNLWENTQMPVRGSNGAHKAMDWPFLPSFMDRTLKCISFDFHGK